MKRQDILTFIIIAVITGTISMFISKTIFSSEQKAVNVPQVEPIDPNLAQVKTDPAYQAFFNANALDPTQLIQIGNTKNTAPFGGP